MPATCWALAAALLATSVRAADVADVTQTLLQTFQSSGAGAFSASDGKALWFQEANGRSCTNCHSKDVNSSGSHQRTGKVIEPMSPSANPRRLTDQKKVNKWFKRNCKWTLGRDCTAQEKGDTLLWLSQQ
ncbi:MAG: DUF1924 domain-containing protein [Halieaceae bacterium]|nr:DUF1924 domain-containing protein [Halieaceae bacterium]